MPLLLQLWHCYLNGTAMFLVALATTRILDLFLLEGSLQYDSAAKS